MESISKNTEQVIIGGLLGDSCITKNDKYNSCLMIVHGPKHLDYLKFKYNFFFEDGLTTKKGIYTKIQHNKKTNKDYLAYGFFTKSIELFSNYRTMFYIDNKKTINADILNKLNPFGLAIWFMDDGNRNIHWCLRKDGLKSISSRCLVLNTQGFSFEENEIIKEYFNKRWDINIKIYKQRNKPVLNMNATNSKKLIEIIKPHIIPSLEYKIDLMYNVTHPMTEEDRKIRMALGQSDANSIVGQGEDIV
jgi:predicted transposase YbfD/YdcC